MTNSKEIIPFNFNNTNEVRAIVDEQGAPWFVANEVCDVLGFSRGRDALRMVDDEDKSLIQFKSALSGPLNIPPRGLLIVNESGLYQIIFQSNKPEAKAFKRWVTHEVLPTIRKKGAYVAEGISLPQLKELNAALGSAIKRIETDKPKVEAFHKLMDSSELYRITDAARLLNVAGFRATQEGLWK